jgi:teichuronic acid biosynthesis glycosyltransferase TuaG
MNASELMVSIIVPAYNAEDYIADTIQSVLNQSYSHWELLIVDDGSTDQTKAIVKKYLDDPRISYFYKSNGGQGSARNLGIKKSKGFYLAFLDADDLWDPHKLEVQLEVLLENDVSLVFSKVRCIDKDGRFINRFIGSGTGKYQGFQTLFLLGIGNIAIPNLSVIATKESVIGTGCFREEGQIRNIEDYDLWFRMLMSGYKFYGMKEVLGSYRVHQDQNTYSDSGQSMRLINYLENLSKEYPDKRAYFEFIILQRLSTFYNQNNNTFVAKNCCLTAFFSNSCVNSYWFEKYLIDVVNLENYLRFRGLLIRKFRRFKNFVQLIED